MNQLQNFANPPPFPDGIPAFVELLKDYDSRTPHWDIHAEAVPDDSLDLRRHWEYVLLLDDPDGLLDTAVSAVMRFVEGYLGEYDSTRDKVTLSIVQDSEFVGEDFRFEVSVAGITLTSAGIEGARRALYYLLDQMRAAAVPALPFQSLCHAFWLKNRISRCFFGPIKRPPFYRDELLDDIDYYPDGYLDRLASEGINGLWLTGEWRELCETSFFAPDSLRAQRIAKLNRTVEKCRRYGIKIWLFCIEPRAGSVDSPLPGYFQSQSGMFGYWQPFCISREETRRYIQESTYSLFRDVPNLGGLMTIPLGERITSCLSCVFEEEPAELQCRHTCQLDNQAIFATFLKCMVKGIRQAGSSAQIIGWIYGPAPYKMPEWWYSLPKKLTSDCILALNYESGVTKAQMGKVLSGGDYWLSCPGPAERFSCMANAVKGHCEMAAKIQVSCSHELATVPFVPVPGLLYRKYRTMHELGVQHVIQCWYFGNYPGTMNKAAGMLASEEFRDNENAFLERLACSDWGNSHAAKIAKTWQAFSTAYENYPFENQFQYYGPAHDGIVWPLHLQFRHLALPRSWKPETFPAGDCIGECVNSHRIGDVALLLKQLSRQWNQGLQHFSDIAFSDEERAEHRLDNGLYHAIGLLFASAANIIEFYLLRQSLLNQTGRTKNTLTRMKTICREEQSHTKQMLALCKQDSRLGYHSEAEVFKFFPKKLAWRLACLKITAKELNEIRSLTAKAIAERLQWQGPHFILNKRYSSATFFWQAQVKHGYLRVTAVFKQLPDAVFQNRLLFLQSQDALSMPVIVELDGPCVANSYNRTQGIDVTQQGDERFEVAIPLGKFCYPSKVFFGICRIWNEASGTAHGENCPNVPFAADDTRLNLNGFTPQQTGWLLL